MGRNGRPAPASNQPGFNSQGEKEGTWLEGCESPIHTHKDGTVGTDIEAFRNTYSAGRLVASAKATDYGKIHTIKTSPTKASEAEQNSSL